MLSSEAIEVKEFTIKQALVYAHSLNKYDDSVLCGIEEHVKSNDKVDYIRLRPNGIDCFISRGDTVEQLNKKYSKWNVEWIKLIK